MADSPAKPRASQSATALVLSWLSAWTSVRVSFGRSVVETVVDGCTLIGSMEKRLRGLWMLAQGAFCILFLQMWLVRWDAGRARTRAFTGRAGALSARLSFLASANLASKGDQSCCGSGGSHNNHTQKTPTKECAHERRLLELKPEQF